MKSIFSVFVMVVMGLTSLAQAEEQNILEAKEVLGKYGRGVVVTEAATTSSRFEQVVADIGYGPVTLGYDGAKGQFRGFISYKCDDPGCTYIDLHEIVIAKTTAGVELRWTVMGTRFSDGDEHTVRQAGTYKKQ